MCGHTEPFSVNEDRAVRAPSGAWDGPSDPIVEGDSTSWLMLFQSDGRLSELEHVAGSGPNPRDLDAEAIEPESQLGDDWFD